ncbi:hypothetical protein RIF29_06740 [Crotalaria pallida]|uniref:Cytochrome P450 n=1 Tax=Crotalaria pallida TaxID=3830 RepID=A0AAN9J3H1_CROPI
MDDLVSILKQTNSNLYLYVLCFFISVLFVYKLTRRSKLNPPPSPPKLPILGNFLQLGNLPHRTFRTLCEKHGPLMLLHLGQTPLLVVQSAELCKEICSTHDVAFANRFQTATGKIFFYERKDVAFAPYGEEWRQKKKLCVVELLSQKRVRSFHPIIKEEVAELLSNIRKACESKDSSVINLTDMLIEIANTIVCRCVLGISNDSSSSFRIQGRKMVNQFADIFIGDFFPWLGFIDTLGGKIAASKATFKVIDGVFDEVIAQHKKRRENNQSYSNDFVGILLELQESGELKFELTNHSIKAIVMLPAETKEIDMDEMIALTLTKKIPLHLVPTLHSF